MNKILFYPYDLFMLLFSLHICTAGTELSYKQIIITNAVLEM